MKVAVVLYDSGATAADEVAMQAELAHARQQRTAKTKNGPRSPDVVGAPAREAVERLKTRNFVGASAHDVLCCYVVLHKEVYGVLPGELVGGTKEAQKNRAGALSRIRSIAAKDFSGDFEPFLDLLRWTWARERQREEIASKRQVKREGGRIAWRVQFCDSLLTDWKIDLSRRRRK